MPHKHKRIEDDESQFNLPPNVHAASLPVGKSRTFSSDPKVKKRKIRQVDGYGADDTPKAFQRLMAFSKSGTKRRSGLDDGVVPTKKQKKAAAAEAKTAAAGESDKKNSEAQQPQKVELKIQPGESMSEFRARVDQALPLAGISKTGRKVAGLTDHRVTKHEKRLKRLQKGWREEEARIREKEMEEAELAEEEREENDAMWEDKTEDLPTGKGKKGKGKKKRKMVVGEVDNNSEDEWEALKKKRESRKGLHDVAEAPPTFDRVPREIFKVKNGAGAKVGNVPNASGSLGRREQLGEERKTIIDTYRELMAAKRNA